MSVVAFPRSAPNNLREAEITWNLLGGKPWDLRPRGEGPMNHHVRSLHGTPAGMGMQDYRVAISRVLKNKLHLKPGVEFGFIQELDDATLVWIEPVAYTRVSRWIGDVAKEADRVITQHAVQRDAQKRAAQQQPGNMIEIMRFELDLRMARRLFVPEHWTQEGGERVIRVAPADVSDGRTRHSLDVMRLSVKRLMDHIGLEDYRMAEKDGALEVRMKEMTLRANTPVMQKLLMQKENAVAVDAASVPAR